MPVGYAEQFLRPEAFRLTWCGLIKNKAFYRSFPNPIWEFSLKLIISNFPMWEDVY